MLKVAQKDYIKHLREEDKLSLSEIVRRTRLSWHTVKKYADSQVTTQEGPQRRRKRRVLAMEFQ